MNIKKSIDTLSREMISLSWYEAWIEEPIRPLVKLLRDNGFNTECSCGHEMFVQCQYPKTDSGELMRLDELLYNSGYRNYLITTEIKRINGHRYDNMHIKLNSKNF